MQRFIQYLLVTLCCLPVMSQEQPSLKMAVISDIHIMAPELLQQEGTAFQNYVIHDRKMLKESIALFESCVTELLIVRPQVVIITGDLTKDGEKISHEYIAQRLLKPLRDAGISVYVVPGNHDINNPYAVAFRHDTVQRVATVTPDEFAQYYQNYGYGQALARDTYSLSYVVQLNDSTRLLAVDACKYEENDFTRNICVTGGRIKPETMDFIRKQAADAKQHGCHILTMMHHGLVRHWKWQNKMMKDYLMDDWKKGVKEFARLGLNIVFTGHFHAQDIVAFGKGDKTVYDIETGSTVSHPLPYRLISFDGRQMRIETNYIKQIPGITPEELVQRACQYAEAGIATIVRDILPDKVPDDVARQIAVTLGKAYVSHLAGDEEIPADFPMELKEACKQLRPYSWKYAFALKRLNMYMFTDFPPADNNLTIELNYAY